MIKYLQGDRVGAADEKERRTNAVAVTGEALHRRWVITDAGIKTMTSMFDDDEVLTGTIASPAAGADVKKWQLGAARDYVTSSKLSITDLTTDRPRTRRISQWKATTLHVLEMRISFNLVNLCTNVVVKIY